MKYCTHCGAEVHEEAVICVKCGCSIKKKTEEVMNLYAEDDTMKTVVKIFLILGCVSLAWLIVPLAWCIPITVSVFHSFRDRRPISTGMKVCVLLFVNLVAGICLFCMDDSQEK